MEGLQLSPKEIDEFLNLKFNPNLFKQQLEKLGGIQGLILKLKTDPVNGIHVEEGNEEEDANYQERVN